MTIYLLSQWMNGWIKCYLKIIVIPKDDRLPEDCSYLMDEWIGDYLPTEWCNHNLHENCCYIYWVDGKLPDDYCYANG